MNEMKRQLEVGLLIATVSLGASTAGCAHGGYRLVSNSTNPLWKPSFVVLYGVDPNPPDLPNDCEPRGTVQAWGKGEKAYPFEPFREAAQHLGGNAVVGLRLINDEKGVLGRIFTYEGDAVRCNFELRTRAAGATGHVQDLGDVPPASGPWPSAPLLP